MMLLEFKHRGAEHLREIVCKMTTSMSFGGGGVCLVLADSSCVADDAVVSRELFGQKTTEISVADDSVAKGHVLVF